VSDEQGDSRAYGIWREAKLREGKKVGRHWVEEHIDYTPYGPVRVRGHWSDNPRPKKVRL
jgi:hypothetical protein